MTRSLPRTPGHARLARSLLVAGVVLLTSAASASTITITFEGGIYDPNPPATGSHGPYDILEDGARYAGFWFEQAGTPSGHAVVGHTHIEWNNFAYSLIDVPHAWREGMQGAHISLLDGGTFDVVSIDYRISRRLPFDGENPDSQFARLPWSYGWDDVQLLLATDPVAAKPDFASFEAQWTAFSIDDGSVFDLGGGAFDPYRPAASTPWRTLSVTGFDDVSEIYIGHTGTYVQLDTIVLRRSDGGMAAPEPGTGVLLALGLGLLAARRHAPRGGAGSRGR